MTTHESYYPKQPKGIQMFLTLFFSIVGATLLFCSLYAPPKGEIHPTVLGAYGMMLTFLGTALGMNYNYRSNIYKIFQAVSPKNNSGARSTSKPKHRTSGSGIPVISTSDPE